MKRTTKHLSILLTLVLTLSIFTACGKLDVDSAVIDYGKSEIYTKEEMDEAIEVIKNEIQNFPITKLYSISYNTDDCNSEKNLAMLSAFKSDPNITFTQAISFTLSLHTGSDAADIKLIKNRDYDNFLWWLVRIEGEEGWKTAIWGEKAEK